MALILNIDTAIDTASICLGNNGIAVASAFHEERNEQAAWLHHAITQLLHQNAVALEHLDAIAVSNGPGSYTGLRIALATAKGLCYALQKPLITLNTLDIIAASVSTTEADYICPMIDARRMEVYTALYNQERQITAPMHTLILSENSFKEILTMHKIVFAGNGSIKFKQLVARTANALFESVNINAYNMLRMSEKSYILQHFAAVDYCEPYYVKDVYIKKID